jgi:hypothetical protein
MKNDEYDFIYDGPEAIRQLSHYMISQEWWVVVPMDQIGANFLYQFAEDFFGEDFSSLSFSEDFHAMVIPNVAERIFLPVFFAKKTRVAFEVLQTFAKQPLDKDQDIQLWGNDLNDADTVMEFLQSTVKGIQA